MSSNMDLNEALHLMGITEHPLVVEPMTIQHTGQCALGDKAHRLVLRKPEQFRWISDDSKFSNFKLPESFASVRFVDYYQDRLGPAVSIYGPAVKTIRRSSRDRKSTPKSSPDASGTTQPTVSVDLSLSQDILILGNACYDADGSYCNLPTYDGQCIDNFHLTKPGREIKSIAIPYRHFLQLEKQADTKGAITEMLLTHPAVENLFFFGPTLTRAGEFRAVRNTWSSAVAEATRAIRKERGDFDITTRRPITLWWTAAHRNYPEGRIMFPDDKIYLLKPWNEVVQYTVQYATIHNERAHANGNNNGNNNDNEEANNRITNNHHPGWVEQLDQATRERPQVSGANPVTVATSVTATTSVSSNTGRGSATVTASTETTALNRLESLSLRGVILGSIAQTLRAMEIDIRPVRPRQAPAAVPARDDEREQTEEDGNAGDHEPAAKRQRRA